MVVVNALCVLAVFAASAAGVAVHDDHSAAIPPTSVCYRIANAISSKSSVYYPGSPQYISDNSHVYGTSSTPSACSVEPGTAQDIAQILAILGATKTPFAVKSGGHAYNPGFSSTTGVLIAMARFNETIYDASKGTVTVGSGLKWDDVYNALAPHSVNVVGGRIQGIGVAGFTLGGGYSWLTNQHGLAVDNVVAFELVLPTGKTITVSKASYPDLFFGLKGGSNNFGIVTRIVFTAHPQGPVWGGIVFYSGEYVDNITAATLEFLKNNDPKAGLLMSYGWLSGAITAASLLFYDGPSPPTGIFDEFMNTPAIANNVATHETFSALIANMPSDGASRAVQNTVPTLNYDAQFLAATLNETKYWGPRLVALDPNVTISYTVEPFLPTFLSHGSNSAYPPSRRLALLPTTFAIKWTPPSVDAAMGNAIRQSGAVLERQASGVDLSDPEVVRYGNYALAPDTPIADIFGTSLPRLRDLKQKYDPHNVMGLTGGWKV